MITYYLCCYYSCTGASTFTALFPTYLELYLCGSLFAAVPKVVADVPDPDLEGSVLFLCRNLSEMHVKDDLSTRIYQYSFTN